MKLHYQTYPAPMELDSLEQTPVIIIPGLFGSTSNWRSFARTLSENYSVIVIDQRNHGRSPHADTQSYFDMGDDLLELLDTLSLDKVTLCGHSMGGKVSMLFSLLHPERVERLAVLDIAPITYKHSHAPFLEALLDIDLSRLESRSAADQALQSAIPDTGTRLFLLQSLTGSAKNYQWRLNLPVLHAEMKKLVGFPADELAAYSNSVETCLIYGENSTYVKQQDLPLIKKFFPKADLTGVPNAGHWLHVEQPALVLAALLNFLQKSGKND
jgi:pimeloyl-ACP methyl ester carboxylesterase